MEGKTAGARLEKPSPSRRRPRRKQPVAPISSSWLGHCVRTYCMELSCNDGDKELTCPGDEAEGGSDLDELTHQP